MSDALSRQGDKEQEERHSEASAKLKKDRQSKQGQNKVLKTANFQMIIEM